ncbi:hypothetical protein ACFQGT_17450 [Natrialbaceae archaeon GCM10025810]|uniref:hypothetical protein n=1 Tax=Halovalidus salilacus TaxID=3075124 RepID=UPI003613FCF7
MSRHSPLPNESIAPSASEAEQRHESQARFHRALRTLKPTAQFLSFWVAVALPFVHVPLLAQGLGEPGVALPFFALLAINVAALYLGHGYKQS